MAGRGRGGRAAGRVSESAGAPAPASAHPLRPHDDGRAPPDGRRATGVAAHTAARRRRERAAAVRRLRLLVLPRRQGGVVRRQGRGAGDRTGAHRHGVAPSAGVLRRVDPQSRCRRRRRPGLRRTRWPLGHARVSRNGARPARRPRRVPPEPHRRWDATRAGERRVDAGRGPRAAARRRVALHRPGVRRQPGRPSRLRDLVQGRGCGPLLRLRRSAQHRDLGGRRARRALDGDGVRLS